MLVNNGSNERNLMALPTTFPTTMPHVSASALLDQLQRLHDWPAQGDLLSICYKMGPGEAALFVIVGVIFLLFGINIFKILVMANAALAGAIIGHMIGDRAGNGPVGATVGGFIAAACSWPLMKHAVAITGAVIGAVVGASAWRVAGLRPELFWAGAMCGAAVFGLMSFVLFRGCVIAFTSLQGAGMVVVGILALIFKYPDLAPQVTTAMSSRNYILPLAVFAPALIGLIYQQTPSAGAAGGAKPQLKK
jgi:hypothetical protein